MKFQDRLRRLFGLPPREPSAPLPPLVAQPWSPLSCRIIAIGIDAATPGGIA